MQEQLKKQLQTIKTYAKTLEKDFKNNLHVIEEQQQQIEELAQQLQKLQQENRYLSQHIGELQIQHQNQIHNVQSQYSLKIREKEQETQDMTILLENKLRKQIEAVSNRLNSEIKRLKSEITEREQAYRRVNSQNIKLNETINQQKIQILDFQAQFDSLLQQKNSMANKMSLHFQELQAVKNSQQGWQQALKQKIKQVQSQKQKVDEQLSQVKLAYKQKLKRQKEQFSKKLIEMAQEKQRQVRELTLQQKQVNYKLEKIKHENKDLTKEVQNLKLQKIRNQNMINKYKDSQMKSNFEKNQKQFEMMQRMFDQNARDLKNQIEIISQEKKDLKQQLDEANSKRESVEKAVERLKIQLINKTKEVDEMKKENRKIRHQMEMKLREAEINQFNRAPANYNYQSKGFDMMESAKVQNEISKVFTQDMGIITDQYFQSSPLRSPKNIKNLMSNLNVNRQAQMLKKIGELQLQIQEYKHLIKKLRQEAENLKKYCEQDKNKEISLYRDKANIYWEKANDKEQQIVSLREQYNELKTNYAQLNAEFKKIKELQNKNKEKDTQLHALKDKNKDLQNQNNQLKQEVKILEDQRKMLEDISAELRSQVHTLKQMLGSNIEYNQPNGKYESNYNLVQQSQYYENEYKQTVPSRQQPRMQIEPPRQKIPKKLHDLVREKKAFSIMGRRAALQERNTQIRMEHIGTESQKQVYQKIKIKNKTPPKVTNYAQLKQKERQRRTTLLQTPSQKQVLERLKSKNILSPEKLNQKGVNYLQLKQQSKNQ